MPWADFLEKYPSAGIFLKGITDPDKEASSNLAHLIETVVSNIINSGFMATGQRTRYTDVLKDGKLEGDCGTLHDVFLEIMEGLNIKDAQGIKSHTRYRCLVTKLYARVLGAKTPNVDNGMWCFEEHYWIEVPGRQIDLLFGGVDPKSLGLEEVKEIGEEDGCPYFQFETVRIYHADRTKTGHYPYTTNKGNALSQTKGAKRKLVEKEGVSCVIL
jgi:hypothetical protein